MNINNKQILTALTTLTTSTTSITTNNSNYSNDFNICADTAAYGVGNETSSWSGCATEIPQTPQNPIAIPKTPKSARQAVPPLWRGVKIDLFQNPTANSDKINTKLKFGVIRNDGTRQALVGAMNSPVRYIWRNVSVADQQLPHWQVVRDAEQELQQQGVIYSASKLCTPNKGHSTDIVCFLFEFEQYWGIYMIYDAARYEYVLDANSTALTQAQRDTNIVATSFIGQQKQNLTAFRKSLGI